jgi:hypothetical protein
MLLNVTVPLWLERETGSDATRTPLVRVTTPETTFAAASRLNRTLPAEAAGCWGAIGLFLLQLTARKATKHNSTFCPHPFRISHLFSEDGEKAF